jgi:hypothetical protein
MDVSQDNLVKAAWGGAIRDTQTTVETGKQNTQE